MADLTSLKMDHSELQWDTKYNGLVDVVAQLGGVL